MKGMREVEEEEESPSGAQSLLAICFNSIVSSGHIYSPI